MPPAVAFEAPWLLAAAALALLPIALFVLERRGARVVDWPAMRFFAGAARGPVRWLRAGEVALLLARVALACALAAAFARPFTRDAASAGRTGGPMGTVVLLDCSMSMGWRAPSGRTLLQRAKDSALEALAPFESGDTAWIVPLSGAPVDVDAVAPLRSSAAVREAVAAAELGGRGASILAALDAAHDLLASSAASARRVIVVTDAQARSWELDEDERWSFVLQRLRSLEPAPSIELVPLAPAGERVTNVAVTSLRTSRPLVGAGEDVELVAQVRRFGESRGRGLVRATLRIDGVEIAERETTLTGSTPVELRFPHAFGAPGLRRAELAIDADALPADDVRRLAVDVLDEAGVLVVEHDGGEAGYFLGLALAPASGRRSAPFRVTSIDPAALDARALAEALDSHDGSAGIVALVNVARVPAAGLAALERRVRAGDGLLIVLGDRADGAWYDAELRARGLLSGRIAGVRAASAHPTDLRVGAGPLAPFDVTSAGECAAVELRRWVALEGLPATSEVFARIDGKSPLLVGASYGLGRVLVLATSPDDDHGDLHHRPVLVPFAHGAAAWLLESNRRAHDAFTGETLRLQAPPATSAWNATVERPGGRLEALSVERGALELALDDRGFHALVLRDGDSRRDALVAVNADTSESDPTRLTAEELATLRDARGLTVRRAAGDAGADVELGEASALYAAPSARRAHWRQVVAVALALAVLEALLAYALARALSARPAGRAVTALRAGVIAALAFMLLDVSSRRTRTVTVKPEALLVIDDSASMGRRDAGASELTRMERVARALEEGSDTSPSLLRALEKRFRIVARRLSGGGLERDASGGLTLPRPNATQTDLRAGVIAALGAVRRETLGAVIVASDGGHNADGPIAPPSIDAPLIALGAGADSPPAALRIVRLDAPARARRDETVELGVTLEARGLEAREVEVAVGDDAGDGARSLGRFAVALPSSRDGPVELVVPLPIRLDGPGRRRVVVELPREDRGGGGPAAVESASATAWIDVAEDAVRVLVLDGGPRWEYRYVRETLRSESSVDALCVLLDAAGGERALPSGFPRERQALFDFDAIVLGDVEPEVFSRDELESLRDFVAARGGGLILIAGPRSMPHAWEGTPLEGLLPVARHDAARAPPALDAARAEAAALALTRAGELSAVTRLDPDRERNRRLWSLLAPPHWLSEWSAERANATALVVLETDASSGRRAGDPQATLDGGAAAERAVVVLAERGAGRVIAVTSDETWRWRFRAGEEFFARFWRNAIAWVAAQALRAEGGGARIATDRAVYGVDGEISIRALVPHAEPPARDTVSDAVVTSAADGSVVARARLELVPQSGGVLVGQLGTGRGAGLVPEGEYDVALETSPPLEGVAPSTRLVVESGRSLEDATTHRDEAALRTLAAAGAGGSTYLPIERARELLERLPARTIEIEESYALDQFTFAVPLLVALAAALAAEWLLRHRAAHA